MRIASKLLVLMTGLIVSLGAYAETFRCDGHIIERGMSQEDVLQHCGEPDVRSNQTRISWTYTQEVGRMDIVLYFYANGDVEAIESVHNE